MTVNGIDVGDSVSWYSKASKSIRTGIVKKYVKAGSWRLGEYDLNPATGKYAYRKYDKPVLAIREYIIVNSTDDGSKVRLSNFNNLTVIKETH